MSADAIVHGVMLGLVYGMLAAGVVLVYRASGVVNFAHGETGAFGAAVLAKLVLDEHWPFLLALVVVTALGAAMGAATQLVVARPLDRRPRLVLLVATIGLSQLVLVGHLLLPSIREVAPFPTWLHRHIGMGSVVLTGRDFLPLALIPAVIVAGWLWLTRTPSGLAFRAAGDNPGAADLAGISRPRVALAAWSAAGALATLAAVLAGPLQGVAVGRPTEALGVGLLLRALAAALVGRLGSLPLALAGGVAVGLIDAIATSGHVDPAIADVMLLLFVLVVVLVRPVRGGDLKEAPLATVPREGGRRWWTLGGCAVGAAVLPVIAGRSTQLFSLSRVALYALVALSLVVLTGWAGELSLGQFALVGVGTFTAAVLERQGVPFLVTIPVAVVMGALVSFVVALPSVRVRGMELAIATLALAVACSDWLFTRNRLLDRAQLATVTRAEVLAGPLAYYEACVVALAGVAALCLAIRHGACGRRLLAVRSDERRAAAAGVDPTATRWAAFAIAGAIAAGAGVLLGGLRVHSGAADFGPQESLRIVAITVIGGAGSVAGAVLGAVVVLGIPAVFGSTTIAGLVPSGVGLLVLAMTFPGGMVEVLTRHRRSPTVRHAESAAPGLPGSRGGAELVVARVTVRFGGRVALDAVELEARPGEVLGVIGANGAGKTTLLDVISGFIRPDSGTVLLNGRPVLSSSPAQRAGQGIGRLVQDPRPFADLSAREVLQLAGGGANVAAAIAEVVATGAELDPDEALAHQSLGTRRLIELAAAALRRPGLLLLDEPTAGLGPAEIDRFVRLVRRIEDTTVVVVEHDVEVVATLASRAVCLGAGRVVATGDVDDVLQDAAVVESFLGPP